MGFSLMTEIRFIAALVEIPRPCQAVVYRYLEGRVTGWTGIAPCLAARSILKDDQNDEPTLKVAALRSHY